MIKTEKKNKHLSYEERIEIMECLYKGMTGFVNKTRHPNLETVASVIA